MAGIGVLQLFHTPGRPCAEMEDRAPFAGDLLRGGMIRSSLVGRPLSVECRAELNRGIMRVRAWRPHRLHFGHGWDAGGDELQPADLI